mmetsp:Transcript_4368/g.9420  ORF Transcript_4368/g.9420 Transcript_4368/m.9420 type:complete len:224 (+) Transcript_4368:366-1037(+)
MRRKIRARRPLRRRRRVLSRVPRRRTPLSRIVASETHRHFGGGQRRSHDLSGKSPDYLRGRIRQAVRHERARSLPCHAGGREAHDGSKCPTRSGEHRKHMLCGSQGRCPVHPRIFLRQVGAGYADEEQRRRAGAPWHTSQRHQHGVVFDGERTQIAERRARGRGVVEGSRRGGAPGSDTAAGGCGGDGAFPAERGECDDDRIDLGYSSRVSVWHAISKYRGQS